MQWLLPSSRGNIPVILLRCSDTCPGAFLPHRFSVNPTAWTRGFDFGLRWKRHVEAGARCPPARAARGRCLGVQGGGKPCPSASAVSRNPAAARRLCRGKIPIAEISSAFGKARICVSRLCEAPASRRCFLPTLYLADRSWLVCPLGQVGRKDEGEHPSGEEALQRRLRGRAPSQHARGVQGHQPRP